MGIVARTPTAASPYAHLPDERFWKTGVSASTPLTVSNLYKKKFDISTKMQIATAGSCFAQHITKYLKRSNYSFLDVEPPPIGISDTLANRYGYDLYSARFGNIYTSRQLLQLFKEAFGAFTPANTVWMRGNKYVDALRPNVEPNGLNSPEEVRLHRERHLHNICRLVKTCDVFIFTLGLTETWTDSASGTAFPTAPGTIAGEYNEQEFSFVNLTSMDVYSDLLEFRSFMHSINRNMKFIFTVSPVPLTATATSQHVLVATTYSKAALRAAAGEICTKFEDCDYFPSYELIATPFSRGEFYADNLRTVEKRGVDAVMRHFFLEHGEGEVAAESREPSDALEVGRPNKAGVVKRRRSKQLVCEDALLDEFAP